MIFFWAFGDGLKLLFLVLQNQPVIFIAANLLQLAIEAVLLGQYFVYRKNDKDIEQIAQPF